MTHKYDSTKSVVQSLSQWHTQTVYGLYPLNNRKKYSDEEEKITAL